jgi:hypothetical protein
MYGGRYGGRRFTLLFPGVFPDATGPPAVITLRHDLCAVDCGGRHLWGRRCWRFGDRALSTRRTKSELGREACILPDDPHLILARCHQATSAGDRIN